jgi:hypothetical protein
VVQVGHQSTAPAVNGFMACSTFEIPLNANTSMFWQTGDTGATYRVVACGYTF